MERFVVVWKIQDGARVELHRIKLEEGMTAEVQTVHDMIEGRPVMA